MMKTVAALLVGVLAMSTALPQMPQAPLALEKLSSMPREEAAAQLKALLRGPLEAGLAAAASRALDRPDLRGVIDNQIIAMLEKLRVVMREGSAALGVPVLDPFRLTHAHFDTHHDLLDFDGNLDSFLIEGLSDFVIDKMKWNTILLSLNFGLTMPKVAVSGEYDLDSVLGGLLPVYGNGPLQINIGDLVITGKAKLGIKGISFYVKTLDLDYTLGEYHSEFSGLLGGGDLSDLLNEVINDLVPEIIEANEDIITSVLSDAIIQIANAILDGII